MLTLHPEILSKNGKKLFAVLPYEEWVAVRQKLEDDADWEALQKAKAEDDGSPGYSLTEMKTMLAEKRKQSKKRS